MKRKIIPIIIGVLLLLPFVGCGFAGEPMIDPMYTNDIYLTEGYRITLEGASKVNLEFRPDLDATKLAVNAKPTVIERGQFIGYSLPIGGADEELYYYMCVPDRWDGESDIVMHIRGWLDTAQDNALDAVKLEVHWNYISAGDVLGAGSNTVSSEAVTGITPQFTMIELPITIEYDEDIPPIVANDVIAFHLVRIASSQEIDGEIVITDVGVIYTCDKFGELIP